jgi:hypothetical protein
VHYSLKLQLLLELFLAVVFHRLNSLLRLLAWHFEDERSHLARWFV